MIAIFLPLSTEFIEEMTLNLKIETKDETEPHVLHTLKGYEQQNGSSQDQVDHNQKIDVYFNDHDAYKLKAKTVSSQESKTEPTDQLSEALLP